MTFDLVKDELQCAALKTEVMGQIEEDNLLKKKRRKANVRVYKKPKKINNTAEYSLWR